MSFLERKLSDNKGFFDQHEPEPGHKERFMERLGSLTEPEQKTGKWFGILRIAAVIAVLVAVSWVVIRYSIGDLGGMVINQVTKIDMPTELQDVFQYYDALANKKVEQIEQYAVNTTEGLRVKEIARQQLEKLDANKAEIEKEYAKNPDNKMLKAALVNNQRKKAEIVDNIIKQLDQASKNVVDGVISKP